MRPIPFNVFQRTQRMWDRLHPYNAAQWMGLSIAATPSTIARAFRAALQDLRIGTYRIAGNAFRVDAADAAFDLLDDDDLPSLLRREMNRPFDADRTMPLRPFVSRDAGGVVVGIVYQHWVADSVSIRLIMRQWLLRLLDRGEQSPVRFERGTLQRRFGPAAAGWSVVAHTAELLAFARTMKRMRRIEQLPGAMDVDVLLRPAPAGLIGKIASKARRDGCTVGDAFLAAAALACAAYGPATTNDRRPDLALGTIVDLRSRSQAMPANAFGLYLGFMISTFRATELVTFDAALGAARRLRQLQNGRRSAEASQLRMGVGLLLGRSLDPAGLRNFYRKRFPLTGGLSNVNLTRDPIASVEPGVLRNYWRLSPTGPLLPLVLTPTTLGDNLTLCCTWQTAMMDRTRVVGLVDSFFKNLKAYADA